MEIDAGDAPIPPCLTQPWVVRKLLELLRRDYIIDAAYFDRSMSRLAQAGQEVDVLIDLIRVTGLAVEPPRPRTPA